MSKAGKTKKLNLMGLTALVELEGRHRKACATRIVGYMADEKTHAIAEKKLGERTKKDINEIAAGHYGAGDFTLRRLAGIEGAVLAMHQMAHESN